MLDYQTGMGYSALDAQAWRDRLDGYAVISGLAVSWDSGLTFTVGSGEATMGETGGSVNTVSLASSTSVTLDVADSTYPRKDTIYLDSTGAVGVETGTPREALPPEGARFDTYQPEPPEPSEEAVILAEIWIPPNTSSLASEYRRDRRVPATSVSDTAVVRALAGLSGTPLEDVEGENLSVNSEGGLNAVSGVDVTDDGNSVETDTTGVDAGENLSASADGDGTVTLDASGGDGGGGYDTVSSVSADTTLSDGELALVDASSGGVLLTLPSPSSGAKAGVEREDSSTNSVSVLPNSGESVNYGSSEDLVAQGESLDFVSDGNDWYVI